MPPFANIAHGARRRLVALHRACRTALRGLGSAMHGIEPDLWRNLQRDALAGRQWMDRALVLAYAVATGLTVVGFTLLAEAASHGFAGLQRLGPHATYLPLLWTPALTIVLLWWTRAHAPAAMGSGIPQVVRALDDDLSPTQQSWLVSLRVSLHKIVLVSGGLLAGLSIGREGPTVQVGAGVMVHARRWLSPQSGIGPRRRSALPPLVWIDPLAGLLRRTISAVLVHVTTLPSRPRPRQRHRLCWLHGIQMGVGFVGDDRLRPSTR